MADPDKPLAELAATEKKIDPPKNEFLKAEPDQAPEPDPETDAAARMRAFEDQHLGADAHRIDGQVERGVGSAYSRLSPVRHRHYEALERLVASEQKLAAAHAALIQADVDHDEAMAAADAAESEPDAPPAA